MNQTLKMSIDFAFHTIAFPYSFSGLLSPTCLVGAAIQLTRSYCEHKKKKRFHEYRESNPRHSGSCHLEPWEIKK